MLQRSQRRQGRCQSFPSEVTFSAGVGQGGRVTPAPCTMLRGSISHGDITKSRESPQDLQPPTSLPPLWCLTGDRGWLRTAITTWEVTAGDTGQIKPCTQEYVQEEPSLKAPQAHPSVPTTRSLIQTLLPAPCMPQGCCPMGPCHPEASTHCPLAPLPKYTLLPQRGHMLGSPVKVVTLEAGRKEDMCMGSGGTSRPGHTWVGWTPHTNPAPHTITKHDGSGMAAQQGKGPGCLSCPAPHLCWVPWEVQHSPSSPPPSPGARWVPEQSAPRSAACHRCTSQRRQCSPLQRGTERLWGPGSTRGLHHPPSPLSRLPQPR